MNITKQNKTKQSRLTDIENKLVVTSREREGEGQFRGEGLRGTIISYKISYKDILYDMGNIANIL